MAKQKITEADVTVTGLDTKVNKYLSVGIYKPGTLFKKLAYTGRIRMTPLLISAQKTLINSKSSIIHATQNWKSSIDPNGKYDVALGFFENINDYEYTSYFIDNGITRVSSPNAIDFEYISEVQFVNGKSDVLYIERFLNADIEITLKNVSSLDKNVFIDLLRELHKILGNLSVDEIKRKILNGEAIYKGDTGRKQIESKLSTYSAGTVISLLGLLFDKNIDGLVKYKILDYGKNNDTKTVSLEDFIKKWYRMWIYRYESEETHFMSDNEGYICFDTLKGEQRVNYNEKTHVLLARGKKQLKKFQYAEAIQKFTEAIKLDPKDADNYNWRCEAYIRSGDYQNALKDITEALRLDPKSEVYYHNRGFIYYYLNDYQNALKDFSETIRRDPTTVENYFWRGLTYEKSGDYQNALKDYSKMIKLKPTEAINYVARGFIYEYLDDYQNALKDHTEAIRLDPSVSVYYFRRGWAYKELGDYQAALADFEKANQLEPCDEYAEAIGELKEQMSKLDTQGEKK